MRHITASFWDYFNILQKKKKLFVNYEEVRGDVNIPLCQNLNHFYAWRINTLPSRWIMLLIMRDIIMIKYINWNQNGICFSPILKCYMTFFPIICTMSSIFYFPSLILVDIQWRILVQHTISVVIILKAKVKIFELVYIFKTTNFWWVNPKFVICSYYSFGVFATNSCQPKRYKTSKIVCLFVLLLLWFWWKMYCLEVFKIFQLNWSNSFTMFSGKRWIRVTTTRFKRIVFVTYSKIFVIVLLKCR